jgi:hypothetical protein
MQGGLLHALVMDGELPQDIVRNGWAWSKIASG